MVSMPRYLFKINGEPGTALNGLSRSQKKIQLIEWEFRLYDQVAKFPDPPELYFPINYLPENAFSFESSRELNLSELEKIAALGLKAARYEELASSPLRVERS